LNPVRGTKLKTMKNIHKINNNIYITSDEEIKPNTYCLINGVLCKTEIREGKIVSRQLTGGATMDICKSEYLEIILTTDDRLIADGVQSIDDDFLEWFVKNPSCESVEIIPSEFLADKVIYEINIPQEEPKQETLEEAAERYSDFSNDHVPICFGDKFNPTSKADFIAGAKWQAERMYSEEDMEKAFYAGLRKAYSSKKHSTCWKEWFEQFKKK